MCLSASCFIFLFAYVRLSLLIDQASKVLSRTRGDVTSDSSRSTRDDEEPDAESQDTRADRPPRAPVSIG